MVIAGSSDGNELEETLPAADGVAASDAASDARSQRLVQGSAVGRYVVIAPVGSGAMGVVLAAYDPQLDRKVALKVLRPRAGDLGLARERLQREAQALAKLGHPNVVAVYDVGVHDDQIFVAMEFVEGQTLRAWMESAPAVSTGSGSLERASREAPVGVRSWREVLEVFTQAGQGLASAHESGLIHRDFKPDNVMLSEDGRVRVMDFGLARVDEPISETTEPDVKVNSLTQTGAMLGTPAYMPLEQFGGGSVDARSDQFSFCVALHEALYGERPFGGDTVGELMGDLFMGEIRVTTGRGAAVPGWVRAVVVRGLATRPEDRFPSMNVLLDALAADPVARRRRIAMRLGLGLALVAGSWAVISLSGEVEQRDAKIEEQASELELKNAALERQLAAQTHLLSAQRGLRASMLVGTEHEAEALLMGVQAVGAYASAWDEAPREAVAGLGKVLAHDPVIVEASHVLRGHEDYITHVSYSPDGTRLATASQDGSARIWDPVRATLLSTLGPHGGQVYFLAFSPDGTQIATTSTDAKARIWNVQSGELLNTLVGHEAPIHRLEISPDGARIATAAVERSVRVWDAKTGELLVTLEGDTEKMVHDLAYTPDGTRLLTAGTDGKARVWDATTGEKLATFAGHEAPILALAVAPDGTRVATGSVDERARIWMLETGEPVATLEGHTQRVFDLAYRPDGKRLTTVSWDATGRVYDATTGELVTTLEGGHRSGVVVLGYTPDGSSLATGSYGGMVAFWDPETGQLRARLWGHKADVWSLAFAPHGHQLVTASVDHTVRLWDLGADQVEVLEGPETNLLGFAYSPDHTLLATVSMDGRLRLWSNDTGEPLYDLDEDDEGALWLMGFSPDGTTLVSKSHSELRLWDTKTGVLRSSKGLTDDERRGVGGYTPAGTLIRLDHDTRTTTFDAHTLERLAVIDHGQNRSQSYSPDDSRLAITTGTPAVGLWDPRTGALMAELETPEDKIHRVVFSPDGTELATFSEQSGVRIWDARRLSVRTTLPGFLGLNQLVYSPDGALLAGAGGPVGMVLWDVRTGEVVAHIEPKEHETGTGRIMFSSAGNRFALIGNGVLRVHDIATRELLTSIDRLLVGNIELSSDGTRLMGIGPGRTLEVWDIDTGTQLTRERVGLRHEDGSVVWPIPPRELTRVGCARLRVFERTYPEARDVCDPLLGN